MKKIRIFAFGGNEVAPVGLKDKDGKVINPDIAMQWQRTADTAQLVADIFKAHPECFDAETHEQFLDEGQSPFAFAREPTLTPPTLDTIAEAYVKLVLEVGLYDPDRSQAISQLGNAATWTALNQQITAALNAL